MKFWDWISAFSKARKGESDEDKLKKEFLQKHDRYLIKKCPKTGIDLNWEIELLRDRYQYYEVVTETVTPLIICNNQSLLYYYVYDSDKKKSYIMIKGSDMGIDMNDPDGKFIYLYGISKFISRTQEYKEKKYELVHRWVERF